MIKNTKKLVLSTLFMTIYFLLIILISAYIRMNGYEYPGLGVFGLGSFIGYILLNKWNKEESTWIHFAQMFFIFFFMYLIASILNYFGFFSY